MVGIYHGELGLDPNELVEREMSLIGSHAFNEKFPEAIAMLRLLAFRMVALIDSEIPLG